MQNSSSRCFTEVLDINEPMRCLVCKTKQCNPVCIVVWACRNNLYAGSHDYNSKAARSEHLQLHALKLTLLHIAVVM
jgi:hypothetical protein